MVLLLLKHGAKPNKYLYKYTNNNEKQFYVIEWYIKNNRPSCIEALINFNPQLIDTYHNNRSLIFLLEEIINQAINPTQYNIISLLIKNSRNLRSSLSYLAVDPFTFAIKGKMQPILELMLNLNFPLVENLKQSPLEITDPDFSETFKKLYERCHLNRFLNYCSLFLIIKAGKTDENSPFYLMPQDIINVIMREIIEVPIPKECISHIQNNRALAQKMATFGLIYTILKDQTLIPFNHNF